MFVRAEKESSLVETNGLSEVQDIALLGDQNSSANGGGGGRFSRKNEIADDNSTKQLQKGDKKEDVA